KELKAIVPVTLTPLGVLLGLLLAFLASRVWTNFDRAREYVGQEVGALRETVLLADALPQEVGTSCETPFAGILISSSLKNGRQWHAGAGQACSNRWRWACEKH